MKPEDFEPERPTVLMFKNMTEQQRLAQLARDWRKCSLAWQAMILRLAAKGAAIFKPKDGKR